MTPKPISTTTTNAAAVEGQMVKVKCHLCGFEWNYGGERAFATCPNCQRKTPVKKDKEAKA